jgi:septum formation protein
MLRIAELLNLNIPLILASESPRRKKLLEQLGFGFTVEPASIEETNHNNYTPKEHVIDLAIKKAMKIATLHKENALIIGADTIVVLDDKILNKPIDKSDAFNILRTLSGNTHTVFSGIALVESPNLRFVTKVQETKVTFRELSVTEINAYIESGSPMDKAGAYGIQDDFGAVFVSHIEGCYYNIVGLPLELLYSTMKEFLSS